MRRTTQLVIAAGVAGAVFATVFGQFLGTPAAASNGWTIGEARTGTVDVLALLERMLDMEPYASAREAKMQALNAEIEAIDAQRLAITQQVDPNNTDPAAQQALYEQYQSLTQQINARSQQAGQELDTLSAEQLAAAYTRIHTAVQAVAEAQGIDRVFSSRMQADDLDASNTNVIVQEVLLRPLLRDATGTDLTDLVRVELGIPEIVPEAEGPEVPPAEQPGEDPAGQPAGQPAGAGGG